MKYPGLSGDFLHCNAKTTHCSVYLAFVLTNRSNLRTLKMVSVECQEGVLELSVGQPWRCLWESLQGCSSSQGLRCVPEQSDVTHPLCARHRILWGPSWGQTQHPWTTGSGQPHGNPGKSRQLHRAAFGVVWCELCARGVCVPTSALWAGATWLILCWFLVSCSFFISIVQIPPGTH